MFVSVTRWTSASSPSGTKNSDLGARPVALAGDPRVAEAVPALERIQRRAFTGMNDGVHTSPPSLM